MIQSVRQTYNQAFSPEQYRAFLAKIDTDLPGQLDFRVAETPVFVPKVLTDKLLQACSDIIGVITRDDFKALTEKAIPAGQLVPNEDEHTQFLAVDFAVCHDEQGELTPQLIELQGFPSLYGFQPYLASLFRSFYPIPESLSHLFTVNTNAEYLERLRQLLVGDYNPEEVILLEIYPEKQKTRIDFVLTEKHTGVGPVCLTKIRKEGRSLYYEKDGRQIQIKRIYNRLIFDDLQNFPDLETDFHLTDDVDVEWVGHPNWFFRISKYTLPLLKSPYIPTSYYLSDLTDYPTDLENYVLKPLFSFAGSGVKLHITQADLDAIPTDQRDGYLLQRKVKYEPVIQSPDGLVKCEIRMLFIWPKADPKPTLITNLSRLSRGEMIGVNFNKNKDWVGGSVCFFEK
ncbi:MULTISPECIES: hypothetical protein [unclassified Spirosoma]|uniref:hypothetical protein n=1 Tax=unclassified Spirosoma TaxID=2621999 RepID=UPI00095AE7A5|nr:MULTISPECIES: hypothetical protein [unclassified Spirosoma]MBN8821174.1 hypothetical protein [Spirosoma sp.]OJW79195.1 MAG: hypothetical protein BGO59_11655 [Spirosoma sp. 48-14]